MSVLATNEGRREASPLQEISPSPEGLILIDKPAGMTSHDVVDAVRKIARTKRVGHAGTLDPFATGLLLIGINRGTKMLTNLVGLDKTYEAATRLGATSTTDDLTGEIQERGARSEERELTTPMLEDIEIALNKFRGGYTQTAPAYSAKRVNGKKLYNLARQGKLEGIEMPKKDVKIHELTVTSYAYPDLVLTVSCSSGTYIRSLARDIGEALDIGAYLTELRRTRIGNFEVKDAVRLDELTRENIRGLMIH
jgi:tRNA pseudouridine55 synthase